MKKQYIRGLKSGLPICLGYISVSFAFGIMVAKAGLSTLTGVLISFTNLTSAGQFAGIEIIKNNGTLIEIAVVTLVINIRYTLMSLSLSQKVDPNIGTFKRMLMSFGITDEIFAVTMHIKDKITFPYFLGVMTLPIFGWSFGTFLGAFASNVLPESIRLALGLIIYGMFIAIIVPPAKKSKSVLIVIIIAVLLSTAIYYTPYTSELSSGWRIIISTIIASAIGAVIFPEKEEIADE